MIRLVVWIAVLAALVLASVWLVESGGTVTLNWQGWRIDTTVAFLALCVAIVAAAAALAYRVWIFVKRAPRELGKARRARRRERGYRALSQGMVAVAAGDAQEAARSARRADSLLDDPPLTMLLSAQAAQMNGDDEAARRYFTAMLKTPDTAFLGLRGLLMQAEREGDSAGALDYARRAYELRPRTPWVLSTLFDLLVDAGDWRGALARLDELARRKAIEPAEAARRRVVVLLAASAEAEAAGDDATALAHARKAYDTKPDSLPAVLRLVSLLMARDRARSASRIIQNAWARTPHPDLARVYAEIGPDQKLKRYQRIEKLAETNPDHLESRIALAEAAIAAELWGVARGHLEPIAEASPPSRVCRLMSELEEGERGDSDAARGWLLRAARAAPDPAWVCDSCGAVADAWQPLCPKCRALGTLDWTTPARPRELVLHAPAEGGAAAAGAGGIPAIAEAETAESGDEASALRLIDVDDRTGGR